MRDPTVNDFTDLENSIQLKSLTSKLGPPRLMQNYTTVGDTMAALKLAQYLEKMKIERLADIVGALELPGDQPKTAPYP